MDRQSWMGNGLVVIISHPVLYGGLEKLAVVTLRKSPGFVSQLSLFQVWPRYQGLLPHVDVNLLSRLALLLRSSLGPILYRYFFICPC